MVLFNNCADSDQIKSNLKDRHLLKKQQRVFQKPDSDKNVWNVDVGVSECA